MLPLLTNSKNSTKGFSLLELIIVIVLISIMAVSLGNLTSNTVYSYIDAKDRNRLSQSSKWIIERVSREVREALPQSIRTGVNGNFSCVEFMPIDNASRYLNIPASGDITNFNAVNYNLLSSTASFVAIMPINTHSLYSITGIVANISSITIDGIDPNQVVINLSTPTNFSQLSPQNRFYLLNSPVSFCLNNQSGQIIRYSNYTISINQKYPPANGQVIGENFSSNTTVFNYLSGTLTRSGLLQINLHSQNRARSLTTNNESIDIFQEVHIRNVP